jgi:hypothetical protein
VLESKNYSYRIKITPKGEFQAHYGKQFYGIPSPIEQNKRHIHLLDRFLKDYEVLPKRLGTNISPKLKSFILISPKSIIIRPAEKEFDTGMVIKADMLSTKIEDEVDKMNPIAVFASIGRISSSSTIEEVARKLASFHKPFKIDFRAKFGLPAQTPSTLQEPPVQVQEEQKSFTSSNFFCSKCKRQISEKVAKFCWQNKGKFKGRAYCFDCQKAF